MHSQVEVVAWHTICLWWRAGWNHILGNSSEVNVVQHYSKIHWIFACSSVLINGTMAWSIASGALVSTIMLFCLGSSPNVLKIFTTVLWFDNTTAQLWFVQNCGWHSWSVPWKHLARLVCSLLEATAFCRTLLASQVYLLLQDGTCVLSRWLRFSRTTNCFAGRVPSLCQDVTWFRSRRTILSVPMHQPVCSRCIWECAWAHRDYAKDTLTCKTLRIAKQRPCFVWGISHRIHAHVVDQVACQIDASASIQNDWCLVPILL